MELDDAQVALAQGFVDAWKKGRELNARLYADMHRDGLTWYDAPVPPRWHRCFAQSALGGTRRCPCGAMNIGSGWAFKNERRKNPIWARLKSLASGNA
ncbi:hypothetical protein [Nonomuraea rubra]|uniref:hypothetical protein n=1 Tax=Nonomuraea rubra TaxID=46180 RepID=UPI0033C283D7